MYLTFLILKRKYTYHHIKLPLSMIFAIFDKQLISNSIVHVKDVRCTLTDMNIFHKLSSVTNKCGRIKKRVDEVFERILISDKLRECLLIEDSDCYLTFTEKEREEFLFRLFKHICIGGEICQQEDDIKPYIDITRKIYHDLIWMIKITWCFLQTKNI
uniref:Cilia- and flagella-associated protein 300 n=1 Tax=Schistosoma japonicum TaxID=6182 RepID=C1LGH0_SCHJA|nr:hypotheticial protein [Schistosoma japonicum]